MFNHSSKMQNVGWKRDVENLLITYTALRDIKAGEELCKLMIHDPISDDTH